MKVSILFLMLLLSGYSTGQTAGSPSQNEAPNKLFQEYYTLACNSMSDVTKADQTLLYAEKAIQIAPDLLDKEQRDARFKLMSILAAAYNTKGEYIRTFEICQDILQQVEKEGDVRQAVNIGNLLSAFYSNIGMYPESNFYADMAIKNAILTEEPRLAGLAYTSKCWVMEKLGENDSAFYYLDLAEQANAVYKNPTLDFVYKMFRGKTCVQIPDSLDSGIAILQKLHEKPEAYAGVEGDVFVPYYLGRGLLDKKQVKEAEALFDEALQTLCSPQYMQVDNEITNEVLSYLAQYYLDKRDPEKVTGVLTRWMPVIQKKHNEDLLKGTASAHIKYQTEKKEQELSLLQSELKVKKLSIAVYIAIILLLILVIAYGILWWQQRKRQLRHLFDQLIRRHLEWKELNLALAEQQDFLQDQQDPLPLDAPGTAGDNPDDNNNQTEAYRRLYLRVLLIMEREHPFLDPNLDLTALARLACTNRSQLSAALNQQTGSNFSTWLAEYRVNYLMEQLSQSPGKSMDELYTAAGFPSRTSFYRQFCQITGLTPGQYMKQRGQ